MSILKDKSGLLHKAFLPTARLSASLEAAAFEKAEKVEKLENQLQLAVNDYDQVQEEYSSKLNPDIAIMGVREFPLSDHPNWTPEMQAEKIQEISEELQSLGVDTGRINAVKERGMPALPGHDCPI